MTRSSGKMSELRRQELQKVISVWYALDTRKRLIVAFASVAMFAAVLGLARVATSPSMSLLYAGLESGPAGEVVRAMEQRGIAHEIRGNAIFVDSAQRDALRMTLASEGLPSNSGQGYELLDELSGFGTTSQMFDAAYWRAKEGELARTIIANPSINAARVHIANTGSNPFQRDIRPKASVMVTAISGGLQPKHAQALKFLVASAVAGMATEDVSIIDSSGGLIGGAEETQSHVGDDQADTMRLRVQRLVEARVGPGNAVVEVSVDTVKTTELIRERLIDPESRVAISTDTEERTNSANDQGSGAVTVASNLPDGDGSSGDSSNSQTNETRERVNYEVSQTEREVTQAPGAVKRLSVAVLVNGTQSVDAAGIASFVPRPEEELLALRDLVASAVGFDEGRGDVITLRTMEFQIPAPLGTSADVTFFASLGLNAMSIIQATILGLVALALGLFVIRPVMTKSNFTPTDFIAPPTNSVAQQSVGDSSRDSLTPLTGVIDDTELAPDNMSIVSNTPIDISDSSLPSPSIDMDDPVARLRHMIGERQDETVEILRSWLEGEEENA